MATDDFNRGDNADLGTVWDANTNSWKIVSNRAEVSDTANDCVETYNVALGDNQYSEAVIGVLSDTTAADAGMGVGVRWASGSTNTGYRAVCSNRGADDTYLDLLVAGSPTTLGSANLGWAATDTIRIEAEGTTIRVKRNGTTQIEVTEGTVTTGRPAVTYSSGSVTNAPALESWAGDQLGTPLVGVAATSAGGEVGYSNDTNAGAYLMETGAPDNYQLEDASGNLAIDGPADGLTLGLTGVAGTGAAGSVAEGASLALAGVAGTGAAGSVVPVTALVGVAATGAAGTIGASADYLTPSIAATGAVGSVGPAEAFGLTGVASTASAGDVAPAIGLTGSAGTGTSGTVGPAFDLGTVGVAATTAAGDITATQGLTLALDGIQVAASAGDVVAALESALDGLQAETAAGDVEAVQGATFGITGDAATGAAGDVSVAMESVLTGTEGAGAAGEVDAIQGLEIPAAGTEASSAAEGVAFGMSVDLVGAQAAGETGDVVSGGGDIDAMLGGAEATASAGLVAAVTPGEEGPAPIGELPRVKQIKPTSRTFQYQKGRARIQPLTVRMTIEPDKRLDMVLTIGDRHR